MIEQTFKSLDKFYPIIETKAQILKINITPALCDTIEKYVLVSWPDIQYFEEHPRWNECICCVNLENHPCPEESWMVPESLFKEVMYLKYIL